MPALIKTWDDGTGIGLWWVGYSTLIATANYVHLAMTIDEVRDD